MNLSFFRRLAVFGVHERGVVCFRCVDGEYRVYDKQTLEVLYHVTEEEAYNWFAKGRELEAHFTFLDSPFRYQHSAAYHRIA